MLYLVIHGVVIALVMVRIVLRPHREPASRIAWIAAVGALPVLGIVAYVMLGEVRLGRRRLQRLKDAVAALPPPPANDGGDLPAPILSERVQPLFTLGQSINGFAPTGGNRAHLLPGSDETIEALVADIDAAQDHVHLLFYIWLPDGNGLKVVEAMKRSAGRGVACRAMVDAMGSRLLVRSEHWAAMQAAGVRVARALPRRLFFSRLDLRNHRKIAVIDDRVTYCGSQNCADPAFAIKAKYAPWVDVMVRFEGPVARQNQYLFAGGWTAHVGEDLGALLQRPPLAATGASVVAQAIGTGPATRALAMPEVFATLIYAARRELVITTPYYVPNEALQTALCNCARRGVATTIVFPARNDSWIVGAASRSYYADLLAAGVRIFEYVGGLLHAKTLTLDGEVTLIGSANLDRRSFDLNFENNMLVWDAELTGAVRARQESYVASSRAVTAAEVAAWPWTRRLWNNAVAMLGPVI